MFNDIIENSKLSFQQAIDKFKEELLIIRTNRISPLMVEEIRIDAYGTKVPLKQVASINLPEPRTIEIQPWDKSLVHQIENEIRLQRPSFPIVVNGETLRINFPPLTEEERKNLTKLVGQKAEEARIKIRQIRGDVWKDIQELEKRGEVSEDDKFRAKDNLQKVVDKYNQQVMEMKEKREEEIMKI